MNLKEANLIATELQLKLWSSSHTHIAGSIRRKKEADIKDIDLICEVRIPIEIVKLQAKVLWAGVEKVGCIWKGVRVDIRRCDSDKLGAMMLTLTGPAELNIHMRARAKKMGYLLNEYGLHGHGTSWYAEKDIFGALEMPYLKPEERESGVNVKLVPSSSSDKVYRVSQVGDTKYCTCYRFRYYSQCKHVKELKI